MEVYTEIEIQAQAKTVWKILSDLKEYVNWNPFLIQADGEVIEDTKISIHVKPPGVKGMTFTPTIVKVQENRELRWKGQFIIPGVFDGEHIFIIEELSNERVRFIQKELYSGLLIPFLAKTLNQNTKKGFELMNQAIKEKSELQSLDLVNRS